MPAIIKEAVEQPDDTLGGASGPKQYFNVRCLSKSDNSDFPYTVVNEVVATALGEMLGLPVSPVVVQKFGGQARAFVLLSDRNAAKQEPPASTDQLSAYIEAHPDEIHGAIVFDLFVANNDRAFGPTRRNLLLDGDGRLVLYDQGNSLFYRRRSDVAAGSARLDAVEGDLANLFDMKHKGNHYWEYLTDYALTEKWCERIRQLPDYLIEAAVRRVPSSFDSPTAAERERLTSFLLGRRNYLLDHIDKHRATFSKLSERTR